MIDGYVLIEQNELQKMKWKIGDEMTVLWTKELGSFYGLY
jgi:hypothetical protein